MILHKTSCNPVFRRRDREIPTAGCPSLLGEFQAAERPRLRKQETVMRKNTEDDYAEEVMGFTHSKTNVNTTHRVQGILMVVHVTILPEKLL